MGLEHPFDPTASLRQPPSPNTISQLDGPVVVCPSLLALTEDLSARGTLRDDIAKFLLQIRKLRSGYRRDLRQTHSLARCHRTEALSAPLPLSLGQPAETGPTSRPFWNYL